MDAVGPKSRAVKSEVRQDTSESKAVSDEAEPKFKSSGFKSSFKPIAATSTSDDVDGEPMVEGNEDLDGEAVDEDVDGEAMDEDVDGEAMIMDEDVDGGVIS